MRLRARGAAGGPPLAPPGFGIEKTKYCTKLFAHSISSLQKAPAADGPSLSTDFAKGRAVVHWAELADRFVDRTRGRDLTGRGGFFLFFFFFFFNVCSHETGIFQGSEDFSLFNPNDSARHGALFLT